MALVACASEPETHPWLSLEGAPSHEIVEVSGASQGQIVLVVPAGAPFDEVMELAERVAGQAPSGATVNARIFDDLETARAWRTAPAEWTLQHLLAVVTGSPESGPADVRWVGPAARVPPDRLDEVYPDGMELSGSGPSAVPGETSAPVDGPDPEAAPETN